MTPCTFADAAVSEPARVAKTCFHTSRQPAQVQSTGSPTLRSFINWRTCSRVGGVLPDEACGGTVWGGCFSKPGRFEYWSGVYESCQLPIFPHHSPILISPGLGSPVICLSIKHRKRHATGSPATTVGMGAVGAAAFIVAITRSRK